MDAWQNNLPHELLDHYRFLQARWGSESKPLTELMQAMLMDQQSVRMDSEEQLLEYCHGGGHNRTDALPNFWGQG